MAKTMLPDDARDTVSTCLCSDCWGQLVSRYDPKTRMSTVSCSTPGCPCNGVVSRKWVERQEGRLATEAAEARIALRGALPALPKGERKLLKELGF
jgi:hypothetical protein